MPELIGVGLARTGTTSLKSALQLLGLGPCYHMWDVMASSRRIRQWRAIGQGAAADWDQVFAGFRSVVDWPAAAFWRELAAAYPAARLVLTVRDPEAWYDSVRRTVFQQAISPAPGLRTAAYRTLATVSPNMRAYLAMMDACVYKRVFDDKVADREHVISVFLRHTEEVRAAFPPQRLLVYDIGDGWGPLCDFLGRPVPNHAFPHENRADEFNRHLVPQIGRLALSPPPLRGSRPS